MKDNLAILEALGSTLPGTAYIIGVAIFGIIGYVVLPIGQETVAPSHEMVLYPYAVSTTWLLYLVGAGLCVGAYFSAQS